MNQDLAAPHPEAVAFLTSRLTSIGRPLSAREMFEEVRLALLLGTP